MEGRKISGSFRNYTIEFVTVEVTTTVRLKLDFKFILIITGGKISDNFVDVR